MNGFDEQPDGDPHSECAAEIHRLEARIAELESSLADSNEALQVLGLKLAQAEADIARQESCLLVQGR